jgi:hypothetical protein
VQWHAGYVYIVAIWHPANNYYKRCIWLLRDVILATSAKCKSIRKAHANISDTQVELPSASTNLHMLKALLERRKMLSDSARAFSGIPDSTCSYKGAFRTLQDLIYMIDKL